MSTKFRYCFSSLFYHRVHFPFIIRCFFSHISSFLYRIFVYIPKQNEKKTTKTTTKNPLCKWEQLIFLTKFYPRPLGERVPCREGRLGSVKKIKTKRFLGTDLPSCRHFPPTPTPILPHGKKKPTTESVTNQSFSQVNQKKSTESSLTKTPLRLRF